MDEAVALDRRIAARIAAARAAQGLTLEELAVHSGVSRSMISRIERAETSPTASLLARLSNALGFGLSTLFAEPDMPEPASPLARLAAQTSWRDPDTGYVRRNVSPRGLGASMEIVHVTLPAGTQVRFDNAVPLNLSQFVWLLSGTLTMTVGAVAHALAPGDCLHMRLDVPTTFHNPGPDAAAYAVIIETPQPKPGREPR